MSNIKKYGLQIDKFEDNHYFLGGGFIGTEEIQPDGQWDGFLPQDERQAQNGIETLNCTVYGTINCLETLENKIFREENNYSERFTGIMAGTDPQSGGSPHNAAESIRNDGVVDEFYLPFDSSIDSVEKYYSPKPMTSKLGFMGQNWLTTHDFKHEWVFTGNPPLDEKIRLIKQALKRSPVGISVYAWSEPDQNGIHQKRGDDNHWCECYGDTEDAWKIFDSYDNTHKLYSKKADISRAKLYWLKNKTKRKLWFVDLFQRLFGFIIDLPAIRYVRIPKKTI